LGEAAFANHRLTDAEAYYLRAIETRREMLQTHPNWVGQKLAIAQTQSNLLLVRQNLTRPFSELEPGAKELIASLEIMVKEDPGNAAATITLAKARLNWAHMLQNLFGTFAAIAALTKSIDDLNEFLAREPNWSEAKGALYAAYGTRAIQYDRVRRYPEAAADYRFVVDLSPTAADRKRARVELAMLLLLAHDHAGAIDQTERTVNDPTPMPSVGVLMRHLTNCQKIAACRIWNVQPYKVRAIAAARSALEQARKDQNADHWKVWLQSIRDNSSLSEFLAHPEIADVIR
jgi:tetratricopeptide (TPR) repeat protein